MILLAAARRPRAPRAECAAISRWCYRSRSPVDRPGQDAGGVTGHAASRLRAGAADAPAPRACRASPRRARFRRRWRRARRATRATSAKEGAVLRPLMHRRKHDTARRAGGMPAARPGVPSPARFTNATISMGDIQGAALTPAHGMGRSPAMRRHHIHASPYHRTRLLLA